MSSLKFVHKQEIRRVAAPTTLSMNKIISLVKELFPTQREESVKLTYIDDEGDIIALNSDEELHEALRVMSVQKVIRFTVCQQEPSPVPEDAVHLHVCCDGCGMSPIVGTRFKCTVRDDFDLCAACEAKHDKTYPMLKVYVPTYLPRQGAYRVDKPVATVEAGKRPEHRLPVHRRIHCDGCGAYPIVGTRFKCTVRPDYDLCENCKSNDQSGFDMTRIDVPIGGRWAMCAKKAAKRCGGESRPAIHRHVQCDGCGMYPLVGSRYNCTVRPNYDLCEACKEKEDGKYPMKKIEVQHTGQVRCKRNNAHWRKECSSHSENHPIGNAPEVSAIAKDSSTIAASVLGEVLITESTASHHAHDTADSASVSLVVSDPSAPPASADTPPLLDAEDKSAQSVELQALEESLVEAAVKESMSDSSSQIDNATSNEPRVGEHCNDVQADELSGGSLTPSEGFEAFHMLRMEEIANACSDDETEEKVVQAALQTTEAVIEGTDEGITRAMKASDEGNDAAAATGGKWDKELTLLAEMGFIEKDIVIARLEAIAGNVDRTAEGELPAESLVRVISSLMGVSHL